MTTLTKTANGRKGEAADYEDLAAASPRDKPWDGHRAAAADVAAVYASAPDAWITRYAARVTECAPWLRFAQGVDKDTGEWALHLDAAHFCRVRSCPVCQWRRSLMWKARMYQALPALAAEYPAARWIFLTLTVRNCRVTDLRATLRDMGKGWTQLLRKREARDFLGWVKSVEITRGADGSAHPHFHVLALVKSTYFKPGHYVAQPEWAAAWRAAARLDYDPVVDVRIVKSRGADGIAGAVAEALKYAVKPSDMLGDASWFLELTRQVRRTRAVASGGVLMHALRDERSEADLLTPDPDAPPVEAADDLPPLVFSWRDTARRYQRRRVEPARAGALDASAWRAGYDAGAAHAPCRPPAGACGVSWSSGWIEGDAAQRRSA